MPRRKRAASPAPVEDVEEEIEELDADVEGDLRASKRLRFNEPLTWRAGKAIPVSELLRRLRTLYEELQPMEQLDEEEQDARRSLAPKAQELASSMLLGHKDKGIRAFAMLGIVEMFRILAPHAPYTTSQLKEIFGLFVTSIIPALATPSDPYNAQHHSILESLGTWQSIVLISDIPGSEQLITDLFSNCFDVVSGTIRGSGTDQVSKNVEFHMSQMLSTLVEESGTLPSPVVEVILAQFLRADLSALASSSKKGEQAPAPRELSSAYTMAQYTCNTCADKMARYIGHYFNAVLIDASETSTTTKSNKTKPKRRNHEDSDDEDDAGLLTPPSEEDLQEAEKAHRLLRELWRSCPDVIRNVVPQVEAQVTGENVNLRVMAVQTIGDMVAGIGAAGWPPSVQLDPSAHPSQSSQEYSPPPQDLGILLTPNAPHAFASVYPSAYQGFMDRHRDKAAAVRSVWVAEAGQIVLTSGGGKGLETEQESSLLRHISDMLVDHDEKVRLSAVQSIARFNFPLIVQKLGSNGGVMDVGSILANLADRAVDPKSLVHTSALELLGRIWGVASGAIAEGNTVVRKILGGIPSHILEARYKNIGSINVTVPQVLNESLLPVGFPPLKAKASTSGIQRVDGEESAMHPDRIRVERLLVLLRDLGERAQKVFFQLQIQSVSRAAYVDKILEHSEISNKAREGDSAESAKQISKLIDALVRDLPDPKSAAEQLGKFFNYHDRRNFALVRFCYSAESDYKRVVNALKELRKRLEQAPSDVSATSDTVISFLRSASLLVYNKSHVPAIMEFARTDQQGLGQAANEILKEIATRSPTVFKAHVKELCETLKQQAPTATTPNDPSAVDSLKACAGFSRRFPKEMLSDRDFYKAMAKMAMHGVPSAAAKHAVTVIVTSADKKDMYVKDIMQYCMKGFQLGAESYTSRLAAMSQLRLLANAETERFDEAITQIVADKVLAQSPTAADETDPEWDDTVSDDLAARILALRLLVNGFRGKAIRAETEKLSTSLEDASVPIFKLLNTLIEQAGELSQESGGSTPAHYKARLRLAAAKLILKLCCIRSCDALFLPADFNRLIKIAQDPVEQVRTGFNGTLKKYLGQGKLRARFYGLVFIYAFEPIKSVKENTATWIRARAAAYAQRQEGILEGVFPRFLSLLAHHDDFGTETDDLVDSVEYIMFYLKNVATETNLPHIYKFAQAMKAMGIQDRIDPNKSENLYVLSDLSEAIIRQYQEIRGWSLPVLPGKPALPQGLFSRIHSTAMAQEISEKRFLPEDMIDRLEDLVKSSVKSKKRKAEGVSTQSVKKPRQSLSTSHKPTSTRRTPKSTKTPKPKKTSRDSVPDSERRKSSRSNRARNYAENDDSEDDEEMEQWQATSDAESAAPEDAEDAEDAEERESSTPPTSQPAPPARSAERTRSKATATPASRATRGRSLRQQKQSTTNAVDSDSDGLSNPPSDMED
ncbi:uncharacterized protein K489DRAFT_381241 [Dissoconium aciculare CBS 342.82]|uniref:ARM repeat-containing protein n=1 Tax=Dissoconium aciculare CBS 342.82 TaxID=1314786 RepID=A0A6J3M3K1_9PEZI|nr:uncharacterized protein K489DRAFT_381241 [Dissoconium aciculare CBS 342.82]KAF1822478.1 hypothetical protein K489DRAFT_381241 [Dissoconium aciculare CBS 342.82]